MRLGDVSGGRDNNFNLIRILAAGAVVVSHAFPIALGEGAVEPLEEATGRSLGWIAVAVFFAISGFLITRSFDRKSRVSRWLSARVMRLFPGLLVVLTLTALVYGPIFTVLPLSAYFSDPATWSYLPRNLSLAFLQFGLPGVFAANPLPLAINGSLWTLVHEVTCYAMVLALGLSGVLGSSRAFAVFIGTYLAAALATSLPAVEPSLPYRLLALRDLSFPFVLGMALYRWRDRVPLSWLLGAGLAALAGLLHGTILFDFAFVGALAYATFLFAYRIGGAVRAYNRVGDYSYGLYIYAFPVQQAALSWHFVESPSLERRERLAELLERANGALWRRPERIGHP